MTRVADFALHQFTSSNITSLQARIAERNIQVTSGKAGQMFKDIPSDTRRLLNLESQHARTGQFVKNAEKVNGRLSLMESNVSQMVEIASKLKTMLTQAASGTGAAANIDVEAQAMLDQVASLLNLKQDGRYLFAGSRTDTPPVDFDDPDFTTPTVPSVADTDYYQGDGVRLSVKADVNHDIAYGATADEAPFEKLIRALHLTATGTSTSTERHEEALSVVSEAVNELPDVAGRLGAAQSSLDTAIQAHDQAQQYTEQAIGEIENVDLTKAITMMAQDQTTLEASFSMLARINSVSLMDFL